MWDGANITADITGAEKTFYARGTELIFSERDGQKQYYAFNGHGDTVSVTDAQGNLLQGYDYDAFGNEKGTAQTISNPFRYCGEYYDGETGLIYLRNRYYAPESGRFTQEDPVKDGLNWYAYAGNNPIAFIDPTGNYIDVTNGNYMKVLQYLSQATGFYGFKYNEDTNRIEYVEGNGGLIDANRNSQTALAMIDEAISSENRITLNISENNGNMVEGTSEYYDDSATFEAFDPYNNNERWAITQVEEIEGIPTELTLIHELQHALSWVNDDASNLQYSNNFLGNKSDVRRKYEEAAAISMYNTVSDELGLGIQDVFTRNRVKIGDMIRRVPTFVYGSFPEEYTNGMVTIPSEFSSDLAQRYRNRYNERRK